MPTVWLRISALPILAALVGLTSCSGPVATAAADLKKTPEFYWSAARETYVAGDYVKTADHLDHLIDNQNAYTSRALPWSLVMTSGMAAGYMEIADYYASGARINKAKALDFRKKAMDYRNMASPLALRFAQNISKLEQLPASITLAFPLPNGNATLMPVIAKIGRGVEPDPADLANAVWPTIERNVLLTACMAAGAPNDAAKTLEILGHASSITPRPTFNKAMATMLEREASLYSRINLDDPVKLAALKDRAKSVSASGGQARTAMAKVELTSR